MDLLNSASTQQNVSGILVDKQIGQMKKMAGASADPNMGPDTVSVASKKDQEKLKSLSKQFEAIMTNQLLTTMLATVPKSALGGFSSEMYNSMMDQEVSNEVSKGKGIGLADSVYRQLVQLDEKVKKSQGALQVQGNQAGANAGKVANVTTGAVSPMPGIGSAALPPAGIPIKPSDFRQGSAQTGSVGMMKAVRSYGVSQ